MGAPANHSEGTEKSDWFRLPELTRPNEFRGVPRQLKFESVWHIALFQQANTSKYKSIVYNVDSC